MLEEKIRTKIRVRENTNKQWSAQGSANIRQNVTCREGIKITTQKETTFKYTTLPRPNTQRKTHGNTHGAT